MNSTLRLVATIAGLLIAHTIFAQEDSSKVKKDHSHDVFVISNKGMHFKSGDSATKAADSIKRENRIFSMSYALFDLGINLQMDNTNYADPSVKAFLNVPANRQNKNIFDQNNAKSINVDIYPWMVKFKALKTHGQKIFISTGLGLQIYNFRYENPVTYTRNPASLTLDTLPSFKKDKLAIEYLSVPLMFTFKTRLGDDTWLVYGVGLTEGLRIGSWTKQVSGQRGKVKVHDSFGLADYNTCLSAEIGIEGVFRVYATYQVASIFANGIDQHPLSIGLRFNGM
jgi:hypothetical protein